MGAPSRPEREMQEIFYASADDKFADHKKMIRKFIERGYKIESQEEDREEGVGQELIMKSLTTILVPIDRLGQLPMIKFEAKAVYGHYDWDEEHFDAWDSANFKVIAFRKNADLRRKDEAWQVFDLK